MEKKINFTIFAKIFHAFTKALKLIQTDPVKNKISRVVFLWLFG